MLFLHNVAQWVYIGAKNVKAFDVKLKIGI